jgi:dTDP-glucose 4,6-dehydratase
MKLLVTGGAGFIGSNFIRYWLQRYQDEILNFDALTYAGNLENLRDVEGDERYRFVKGNITNWVSVKTAVQEFKPDIIVHFAAESHNSRSITSPTEFFRTNVMGTQTLLEAARRYDVPRFHHVGTVEEYGEMALDDPGAFTEDDPYRPRTPYNASKAGASMAVRAYHHTFGLQTTISLCANNYGPYQFPEKLIPLFITNLLDDKPIPLFKSSNHEREWIYVLDHCSAIDLIIHDGGIGESYNIGTGIELSIEDIADYLLIVLGKPNSLKTYVPDRPAHDQRYLLDSSKITDELGWLPLTAFSEGLSETIEWYKSNRDWWEPLKEFA